QGHLRAAAGFHVNVLQRIGRLLELRVDFQQHVVLVQLREDSGDLALAESVIERVVNGLGQNAEARGRVAIDDQVRLQTRIELVAGNVPKLRDSLQFRHQFRRPGIQLLRIRVFDRVLKLRAADPVLHRQVLYRLHVERNAHHLRQLRLQPANDFGCGLPSLSTRFQVDLNAAAVGSRVNAIHANEGRQAGYIAILQNNFRQFLLALRHGVEGNRLRGLRDAENHAGVLHREEALGHDYIKKERQDQGAERDQQGRGLMTEDPFQSPAIVMNDALIEVLRGLVNAPRLLASFRLQQLG